MPFVIGKKGGGGGGEISVYVNNTDPANLVTNSAASLVWDTSTKFGFTARLDTATGAVIIGEAPNFVDPPFNGFNQNNPQGIPPAKATAPFHVEFDPIADYNASVARCTKDGIVLVSKQTPVGGFGNNSKMKVVVTRYEDGLIKEAEVVTNTAVNQVTGLTVNLPNYSPDGDGSQFKSSSCTIVIDLNALFDGVAIEGSYKYQLIFSTQKGETKTFNQNHVFYDKDPTRPSVATLDVQNVTTDSAGIRYLSGIGYFTGKSNWKVDVTDISKILSNCGTTANSLILDLSPINCKNAGLHFNQPIYTFDTPYSYDSVGQISATTDEINNVVSLYYVNPTSYRHVGLANFKITPYDPFGAGTQKFITPSPRICYDNTVTPESTDTVEYFETESRRLQSDYTSVWDSEKILVDGEALVGLGKLMCGNDFFRIDTNTTVSALGTASNLTAYLPNKKVNGDPRQQPNYSTFTRNGVYFRKFFAPNPTAEYAAMNINVMSNGDLKTLMDSGKIKIFIWKLASSDPSSNNLTLPPAYLPTQPLLSQVNSIWAHSDFDFNTFNDGVTQTPNRSGARVSINGSVCRITFGGFNVVQGILMRVEIASGVTLDELGVTFG